MIGFVVVGVQGIGGRKVVRCGARCSLEVGGGSREDVYRRCRRMTVVVSNEGERQAVWEASERLEDVGLDVMLEREVWKSRVAFEGALERADALLFSPKGKRKTELGEQLLPLVEGNYERLSVCLFSPTSGMDFLRLNKLNNFDAGRVLRGRVMKARQNHDDNEDAHRILQRLPDMLSFISPAATDSVNRFIDLVHLWDQRSSKSELSLALQLTASNLPPSMDVTKHAAEENLAELTAKLDRIPTKDDFVVRRKEHIYEAIANGFGGLEAMHERIITEQAAVEAERKRKDGAKLRLIMRSELQEALTRFAQMYSRNPTKMPKEAELNRAGRFDLRDMVQSCGGFEAVAQEIGLVYADNVISSQYPTFEALAVEVRSFLENRALELDYAQFELGKLIMPRYADFRAAGRDDLIQGIRAYGGIREVAKSMQLRLHYNATQSYEGDFEGLKLALEVFRADVMDNASYLPTASKLREHGRLDIIAGIKHHGGVVQVANALGLKLHVGRKVQTERERDFEWLKRELRETHECRMYLRLPTSRELLDQGRVDILRSIRRHGGREKVARRCDLTTEHDGTLLSEDFGEMEICESNEALTYNLVPSGNKMSGHNGLEGGGKPRRPAHFFKNFEKVRSELTAFIFDRGDGGMMPTASELLSAGRGDLLRGIKLHGGQKEVARKLGLVVQSQSRASIRTRKRAL